MPPTGALPAAQVAVIKQWIDEGAEWPDALAGDVPTLPLDPPAVDLSEAIRKNDETRIAAALGNGSETFSRRGPGGATPLMYAVLYGRVDLVRSLLDPLHSRRGGAAEGACHHDGLVGRIGRSSPPRAS